MIYTYYRVLNKEQVVVFECIYDEDNSSYVTFENNTWELGSLLTYFEESDLSVETHCFTTKQLYNILKNNTLENEYDY